MNTVSTSVSKGAMWFREILMNFYDNPFVAKIISIILAIIVSFVLLALSRILASVIKNKITKNFVTQWNKEIQNVSALIWDIIFYALAMFSFFISFSIVGINVGLIMWGISIWVWFAFRQTLTNMISWIMIFTTKEYQPWSLICIEVDRKEVIGKIEEINMKDTIIRWFDLKRIVIPNSEFVKASIKTYSIESLLKVDFEITVDISLDIEKIIEETSKVVNSFDFVKYKEYTEILVDSFDDKKCKLKVVFCFDPHLGLSTDSMKSQAQKALIKLYQGMKKSI